MYGKITRHEQDIRGVKIIRPKISPSGVAWHELGFLSLRQTIVGSASTVLIIMNECADRVNEYLEVTDQTLFGLASPFDIVYARCRIIIPPTHP